MTTQTGFFSVSPAIAPLALGAASPLVLVNQGYLVLGINLAINAVGTTQILVGRL